LFSSYRSNKSGESKRNSASSAAPSPQLLAKLLAKALPHVPPRQQHDDNSAANSIKDEIIDEKEFNDWATAVEDPVEKPADEMVRSQSTIPTSNFDIDGDQKDISPNNGMLGSPSTIPNPNLEANLEALESMRRSESTLPTPNFDASTPGMLRSESTMPTPNFDTSSPGMLRSDSTMPTPNLEASVPGIVRPECTIPTVNNDLSIGCLNERPKSATGTRSLRNSNVSQRKLSEPIQDAPFVQRMTAGSRMSHRASFPLATNRGVMPVGMSTRLRSRNGGERIVLGRPAAKRNRLFPSVKKSQTQQSNLDLAKVTLQDKSVSEERREKRNTRERPWRRKSKSSRKGKKTRSPGQRSSRTKLGYSTRKMISSTSFPVVSRKSLTFGDSRPKSSHSQPARTSTLPLFVSSPEKKQQGYIELKTARNPPVQIRKQTSKRRPIRPLTAGRKSSPSRKFEYEAGQGLLPTGLGGAKAPWDKPPELIPVDSNKCQWGDPLSIDGNADSALTTRKLNISGLVRSMQKTTIGALHVRGISGRKTKLDSLGNF